MYKKLSLRAARALENKNIKNSQKSQKNIKNLIAKLIMYKIMLLPNR